MRWFGTHDEVTKELQIYPVELLVPIRGFKLPRRHNLQSHKAHVRSSCCISCFHLLGLCPQLHADEQRPKRRDGL